MKKSLSFLLAIVMLFSVSVAAFAEGDSWTCSNGHENPSENLFCGKCGEKKPQEGTWTCSNGHENPVEHNFCSMCGEAQPAASDADQTDIAWKEPFENEEYETAFPLVQEASDKGNIEATAALAMYYIYGYGETEKDFDKGFELAQKAADAGNARGMFLVGRCYASGDGVIQDYKKAVDWYQKSADAGDSWAMANLGGLYAAGDGVTQDSTKALEWYRKAADLGNTTAMWAIGAFYYYGDGVNEDFETALSWWHKAADLEVESSEQAYEELVEAYKDQNYARSIGFCEKAKGYKDAEKYANLLEARFCYDFNLSDVQIEKLEKEIVKDISFEDAAAVLVCNIRIAEAYLSGQWYAKGGYYFKVVNSISETNLPDEPYTGKDYYNISQGTYYEYNDWGDPDDRIAQLSFEPVSATEMKIYCFKNNTTYSFTKKT